MKVNKKENLIYTAKDIFYKNGYNATGVERIVKEAGTTKATLYSYFASKENLIAAVLEERHQSAKGQFIEKINNSSNNPKDRIVNIFIYIEDDIKKKNFYGCPFINASSEYTDKTNSVRKISKKHYAFLESYIKEQAENAGVVGSKVLSEQLILLIMGAYSSYYLQQNKLAVKNARDIAKILLQKSI